jgi:hypothetical protein
MVRKIHCVFIAPDAYQPAIRLLELAHTVCIMNGLFVMTIKQRGQTIESTSISMSVGFFFSGSVGPVVQVSKICIHQSFSLELTHSGIFCNSSGQMFHQTTFGDPLLDFGSISLFV